MFQKILVPLDGSEGAERAIPVAARLARAAGGSVVFMRVVLPPVDLGKYSAPHLVAVERRECESNRARAASYLAALVMKHANELMGIEIEFGVAVGLVPQTICRIAQKEGVDLIVLCDKGERGLKRWMFGSIACEVAQHSPVPLLVLDEHGMIPRAPYPSYALQMVVALDGSLESEALVNPSAQLLTALAGPALKELHLLRILTTLHSTWSERDKMSGRSNQQEGALQATKQRLESIADRLRESLPEGTDLVCSTAVVVGPITERTILGEAESLGRTQYGSGCTLIALAAHSQHGLSRYFKSGLVEHLIGTARFPLLIVPLREAARTEGVKSRARW
jgi:nucleotide-binding universal stress UspA family protein